MTTRPTIPRKSAHRRWCAALLLSTAVGGIACAETPPTPPTPVLPIKTLSALHGEIRTGDLVFTRIDVLPFREVASATGTWTNHVGIVVGRDGDVPLVAESTFPWSKLTPLPSFVARSESGRVAVLRLPVALDEAAQIRLRSAADRRLGVFYDTGFNLHSRRQFCSRFVHEVVDEAMGERLGRVQTLAALFAQHPQARIGFWRAWYLGSIPWSRQTITPASLLQSPRLQPVFDGQVVASAPRRLDEERRHQAVHRWSD